jgi:hypothetical protein
VRVHLTYRISGFEAHLPGNPREHDINWLFFRVPVFGHERADALNDVMILSYDANLGRMVFSEGTAGPLSLDAIISGYL